MYIFILKADRSVEVIEPFNDAPHYLNTNYAKGQLFRIRYASTREYWDCLHRGNPSSSSIWVYASKVPVEVKMAALIVN